MARDIPVGNGNLLIAFDKNYRLAEFYYPRVGQEGHTLNESFRFGVWVNGVFNWVDSSWEIKKNYLDDSLVTEVELTNKKFELQIIANDFVDFHENIYVKKLILKNLSSNQQEVRLFFCHEFHISNIDIGDTASYRPDVKSILHYKGERYFLINILANNECGVTNFACGEKRPGLLEGSWKDAEDGVLSGNSIAQGSTDSVISTTLLLQPNSEAKCFYWICAATNWEEVVKLNSLIVERTPEALLKRTYDYWKLWVNKENLNHELLPDKVFWLYKRSLLILRTQINNCGSIISANDSDNIRFNRDTYSYMWPRDSALIAYDLDLADYAGITRNFFTFCGQIIDKNGYFMHKYNPSGTIASSWHPWFKDGKSQLPIQEDETALVIWSLWHHYTCYKDVEFIKPFYKTVIKNAGNFMLNYRDAKTKLPLSSYDLWEERQGISTFTVAAVYGGLQAAANFAYAFGETEIADSFANGAKEIKNAMLEYLYLEKENRFARMINFTDDGKMQVDATIDASLFGVFAFGAFPVEDVKVKNTMTQVRNALWCNTKVGGLARYQNDFYHRIDNNVTGNPWFITTLWLAKYYIALAKNESELQEALHILNWVADHALPSGVLAEQLHPHTGEIISVSPLTWSHGTFVGTVQEYLNKLVTFVNPSYDYPKYVMDI